MPNNPVIWSEIFVQDIPRAKAFYESVFRVKLELLQSDPAMEMWAFPMVMDRPGIGGTLVNNTRSS